jgi:hypothetical protein
MIRHSIRQLTAALICMSAVFNASADTVTLSASKDNTLFGDPSGTSSNGSGNGVFAGRTGTAGGGLVQRGVVAFNLAGSIPPGSTITSAALKLFLIKSHTSSQTITVHKLLADWGEGASDSGGGQGAPAQPGDATWLYRFYPGSPWNNQGGDFVAQPSASLSVGSTYTTYTWQSAALAADVQSWINNPASNFGWLLKGNEAVLQTAKKFASREYALFSPPPLLTIQFTPPPPPTPCPADIAPPGSGNSHGNGYVNIDDLFAVINAWGPCGGGGSPCIADINDDGAVNIDDLFAVINSWGPCP